MGDDEGALERVGRSRRPHRPGLWIGAWVIGLAAVVAVAVAGRTPSVEDPAAVPTTVASLPGAPPVPVALASPAIPDSVPRLIRPFGAHAQSAARPLPTLGDDGLVGGTSYSSAAPAD